VGLENGDELAVGMGLAQRREQRVDLARVMRVVHVDRETLALQQQGLAAADAGEVRQCAGIEVGHQILRHGQRGHGVLGVEGADGAHIHHMLSKEPAQAHALAVAVLAHEVAGVVAAGAEADVSGPRILLGEAVEHGVRGADEHVPAGTAEEPPEGRLDLTAAAVMVGVVPVQVGNDSDLGREVFDGAVALVNLGHEPLVGAAGGGRGGIREEPAQHVAAVEVHACQRANQHPGGGRLAMAARNGDEASLRCLLGQHLAPADLGDAALSGLGAQRVLGPDGTRVYHARHPFGQLRSVEEAHARLAQQVGHALARLVVPRQHVDATLAQVDGERAHAHATGAHHQDCHSVVHAMRVDEVSAVPGL
jgi:hypothetical protein